MKTRRSSQESARSTSPNKECTNEVKRKAKSQNDSFNVDEYQDLPTEQDNPPAKRPKTGGKVAKFESGPVSRPAPNKRRVTIKHKDLRQQTESSNVTSSEHLDLPDNNLGARVAELENKYKELMGTIDNQGEDISDLKEDISELKEDFDTRKESRSDRAQKTLDDSIERIWAQLRHSINEIVHLLPIGEIRKGKLFLKTLQSRLNTLSLDGWPQERIGGTWKLVFTSFIWSFVYTDIFLGRGSQWKGGVMEDIQKAKRKTIISWKDPESRAKCASWFSDADGTPIIQPDDQARLNMRDEFADTLLSMFYAREKEAALDQLKVPLQELIYKATELAGHFMSSKAFLMPDWPTRESEYKIWRGEEVEAVNWAENEAWERFLVIAPGLEKFGNADGEDHHLSVVLVQPRLLYY